MDELQKRIDDLVGSLDGLQEKAAKLTEKMESAEDSDTIEGLKSQMSSVTDELKPLQEQYVSALREREMADMKGSLGTLESVIDELKGSAPVKRDRSDGGTSPYGAKSQHSFFADIKAANKGDQKARTRIEEAQSADQKAMVEHTDSQGGFLVPEEYIGGLVGLRDQLSVVRGLANVVSVGGDTVRIASQTSGLLAGWVAELAEKPVSDMTFGEVTANVFTAAGMSVASNQLLADSKYSIDNLIFTDLAKRLAIVEETAIIGGTGDGQPRGILNTPGVDVLGLSSTDVVDLLDKIVDAISDVYTDHLASPTAILLHPRVWANVVKAREATAPTTYLVGSGGSPWGRRANDPAPGLGAGPSPVGSLFGVPVYASANVPINLGTDGDESAVIVGDFSEALILDREGIQTDQSEHVYFTSNQTIFRAEERMGFTAARDPKAFKVIGGAGLAL